MRIQNAGYHNSLSGRERMRFEGRHASWLLGELTEPLEVDLREDRRQNVTVHYKAKRSRQIIAISPRTFRFYVAGKNIYLGIVVADRIRIQLLRFDYYLRHTDII